MCSVLSGFTVVKAVCFSARVFAVASVCMFLLFMLLCFVFMSSFSVYRHCAIVNGSKDPVLHHVDACYIINNAN